jgi:hypothetical protein
LRTVAEVVIRRQDYGCAGAGIRRCVVDAVADEIPCGSIGAVEAIAAVAAQESRVDGGVTSYRKLR